MTKFDGILVFVNDEWMVNRVFNSGHEKLIHIHSCSKKVVEEQGIEGGQVRFSLFAESMPRTVNGFVTRAVIEELV